jgi:hypothetical protein
LGNTRFNGGTNGQTGQQVLPGTKEIGFTQAAEHPTHKIPCTLKKSVVNFTHAQGSQLIADVGFRNIR